MRSRRPWEILVAGWFPSIDDPFAGRFIADQASALRADGRVRPTVAAFENIPIFGDDRLRDRQVDALRRILELAGPPSVERRGMFGPDGIPVARLPIAAGPAPQDPPTYEVARRAEALGRLILSPAGPRPQLVHGHVGYPDGAAAAELAARLGVPFVLTEHATYLDRLLEDPVTGPVYRETARRAQRVIAVSQVLASQILEAIPDISARLVVIPNTVAVDDFAVTEPHERREGELLWVGYRRPIKGIDTLLRAFRLVRERQPDATLRLIGRSTSDEDEATWKRLAEELGVGSAVTFDPPADRAGVAAAMARASVFVHPSNWETFGVVAVEALAAGLPVVACDSGGVAEVMGDEPEALGALVPRGDPEALADAVVRTLDRRSTIDPWALRSYAVGRFGSRAVAERIADLYDDVLAGWTPAEAGQRDDAEHANTASHGPSDAAGGRGTTVRRIVFSAFLRGQLDRFISRTAPDTLAGLELVTVGRPVPAPSEARLAPDGSERRITRLLADPTRRPGGIRGVAHRLRRLASGPRGRLERIVLGQLGSTLGAAAAEGTPGFVGLSGLDYLVALPLVLAGRLRPMPGGIRWLADHRAGLAELGAPASGSSDPASSLGPGEPGPPT